MSDNMDQFHETSLVRRWRRGVGEFTYRVMITDDVTAFRQRPVWEARVYQRPTREFGGPGTRVYPWESIRFYRSPDKAKTVRKAEAFIQKELAIKRDFQRWASKRRASAPRKSVVEEGPVSR